MTSYQRGTEGRINDILTVLGTTTLSFWPFWESVGQMVHGVQPGVMTPSDEAAARNLQDEFSPVQLPSGLYSYNFHATGNNHLATTDQARHTFGNGTVDSPFSCGAWIRPAAIATNTILGKYDATGTAREWQFAIDSSGKLSLELYDESADTTEIATSTSALTLFQWQFVVASYDGGETAPVVNLYVNGTLANDGTTAETGAYVAMEDTATPLLIGASGTTAAPATEFHGRIAMPFICGKQLTAAEVTTLYGYMAPMVGITA